MILTELVLHNFGVYRNTHVIDLSPMSTKKPIILFGGLNGGGKTTLLDAIQLALYGSQTNISNRGDVSYSEYLRQSINHFSDEASIELSFTHFQNGNEAHYRVKRAWKKTTKRVLKDEVEVFLNGEQDETLSMYWSETVEELLPRNISNLFFFDGEKIEDLANPKSSADIIRTGIYSLLGLDTVNNLIVDLKTIERRRLKKHSQNEEVNDSIKKIELEISRMENQYSTTHVILAQKQSEIDSLHNQISQLRQSFKNLGGEIFEKKDLIEVKHQKHIAVVEQIANEIRNFVGDSSSLSLVEKLLWRTKNQAEKEQLSQTNTRFLKEIKLRDKKILEKLSVLNKNNTELEVLERIFSEDLIERQTATTVNNFLNVNAKNFRQIDSDFFSSHKKNARNLAHHYKNALDDLAMSHKEISSIPEQGLVQEISDALNQENMNLAIAAEEYKKLSADLDFYSKKLNISQSSLDKEFHKINENQLGSYRNNQVLSHSQEVRSTLAKYSEALVKKHIFHLESLIEDSFRILVRKGDLIDKVRIDPLTFNLDVFNNNEETIPLARLSAGERQLMAISILWGLAKASGRSLPIIIDTPLGRLDNQHRTHLVTNYFPNASHQVILLSTDTEINAKYRNLLKNSIGKEYLIDYSKVDKSSKIVQGYF